MSRQKSHEEFIEELRLSNKNFDNIEVITKYSGIKNKIGCKCKICGCEWYTSAEVLKNGSGCPTCKKDKMRKNKTRSLNSFLDELLRKRNDIEYIDGYQTMKRNAKFKCKIHNVIFETTPQNVLKGTKCYLCRKEIVRYNKLSKEEINKSISHLKIELVNDYINSKTPTKFKCMLCGEEFISKYELVKTWKNCGCQKCRSKNSNNEKLKKRLLNRLKKIEAFKSEHIEILNYDEKCQNITCKCLICSQIYETTYDSIIMGSMHKKCASIEAMKNRRLSSSDIKNRVRSFNKNINIDFSTYSSSTSKLKCECIDCGHVWMATSKTLVQGKGCPICARKIIGKSNIKDINEYAELLDSLELTIISNYINASTPVTIKCNVCGNAFESTLTYLSQHRIGCPTCAKEKTRKEKMDIFLSNLNSMNPKIHMVSEYVDMSTPTSFICEDCCNEFIRTPHDLLRSCNCPKCTTNSKLEYFIKLFLDKHKIDYVLHKSFNHLVGLGGKSLSYDFYLPHYNLLIEAQGEQHEKPIKIFGGEQQFEIQQIHDKRKRDYAHSNNIKLLEIWHSEIKNINNILSNTLSI